jgi:hypothetical protein
MRITIKNLRLAFPSIFEMSAMPSDPDNLAYSAKFIVPADHPQVKDIEAAMQAAADEKWGPKAASIMKNMTRTGRKPDVCFVKEPYTNKDGDVYDGFEGAYTLSARNGGTSPTKPSAFNQLNEPVSAKDGLIYGGCYVDASVDIYAIDNGYGRRISCSLRGVRFAGHGSAFAGGVAADAGEFGAPAEVAEDFV